MVRVPEYQRNVSLRPIYQQSIDVRATPEAFGAGIGRGLQSVAGGLSQLADSVRAVQELEDSLRAKEADNQYSDWMRERMYGENGFMTLQGRNAVEARRAFEEEAERKRKEFGANLTPGAALAYQQASQARLQSALRSAIIHAAGERKSWFNESSKSRIETFANDALASYNNPHEVSKNIAAGVLELRERASMMGWDEDTLSLRESEYVSSVHKSVALRIAQDDPLRADDYIKSIGEGLTERDRMELNKALEGPKYAALGERNADETLEALPADDYQVEDGAAFTPASGDDDSGALATVTTRGAQQTPVGPRSFEEVTQQLIGMHEVRDRKALADFIRRAAGIKIDPAMTPWCAAFVNAVLGAQGIKGTGKLNARSFLNFGVPTDDPRPGDIVVFSRGNSEWQGHVGFFQGWDRNGNMLVLSGNQSNSVNVSAYSTDRLLGIRRAGPVNEETARLPNYSPAGLAAIYDRVSKIKDPKERAATMKAIDARLTMRKRAMDAERESVQSWVEAQLAADPSMDLMRLPAEVRTTLGSSGMTAMLNYQEKLRSAGEPTTDERLLHDLQMMDPQELSEMDLFQYRGQLSNSDWEKVKGWKASALKDKRAARDKNLNIKEAFGMARQQLQAVGIIKRDGKMKDADHAKVAEFNNRLAAMMDEFQRDPKNLRPPTQIEIQSMINKLLLPVVMRQAGGEPYFFGLLGGDTVTEMRLFEAGGEVGEVAPGVTVDLNIDYDDIPVAERVRFEAELRAVLQRKPTEAEVERRYGQFLLEQYEGR